MRKIIKESGLRNIKALAKRYPKAKIYFHQDLDGVTTALAMKNYLENNGIEVVDSEIIQYGDKEFSIKKQEAEGDVMPVLVDFAHGKPMFVIHTDHHDSQSGVEKDTATSFRPSRSNVATLSQIMSPKEIFPTDDILLISTVDSADFARFGLKPKDIMNFIFQLDQDENLQKNKFALGLATNKLLLAYKNKPGFLESLVMNSEPSLLSIYQNIKKIAQEKRFATPQEMSRNQSSYIDAQKQSNAVKFEDGIIIQYGGGSMFKPGSYDRYTPFENYPEADFLVIAWPMGLVQASCNPFKSERELKGVNLGEIAQEVLVKWEPQLQDKIIPLSTIKWVSETSIKEGSVGFTQSDLEAFYGDKIRSIDGGEQKMETLKKLMDKPSTKLVEEEWSVLDKLGVPAWEMIQANSGGHKCITNISALNYFGRSKRPPQGQNRYSNDSDDSPHVKFAKMIQSEFVRLLKDKINESKNITEQETKKDDPKKADIVTDDVGDFLITLKNFNDEITQQEVDSYQFQKVVETFQIALELLGYKLPRFGVDGLFGPETAGQLNKFKQDNEIEVKKGKSIFTDEDAEKMYELLVNENIQSNDIKKYLDSRVSLDDYEQELQDKGIENLSDGQYMKYFFDEIFKKLDITPTKEKYDFFTAWRQAEGGNAKFNPFNTTKNMDVDGVTNYNSVGVKNYPNNSTGIMATVNTLKLPYYDNLMSDLRNDNITTEELASNKDLKTWGTGNLVTKVIKTGVLKPKRINRV